GKGSFKGSLALAEGNKARFEMDGQHDGKAASTLAVSDGTKTATVADKKALPIHDTRKNNTKNLLTALAHSGLFVPMMLPFERQGERPPEVDINEILKVSDLKLGKKEKVDGQEAQAIEYTLTVGVLGQEKIPFNTTVWVGTGTHLPLKRVLTARPGGQEMTLTETYSNVAVDGKIDPKMFELPK